MSPLENYKNLKGYLSSTDQCLLADETIVSLSQYIEELEQQLSFEKRQKVKAREQRDEQTQLAKKYKDQLSVLLNKK